MTSARQVQGAGHGLKTIVNINQLKNRFLTELLYVIPGPTMLICVRIVKSRISTGALTANMREVCGTGECLVAVHSVRMPEPWLKAPGWWSQRGRGRAPAGLETLQERRVS